MGVYEDYLAAASGVSPQASVKPNPEYGPIPPTLGSGLSAMTQINPGANFMTGSAPGAAPLPLSIMPTPKQKKSLRRLGSLIPQWQWMQARRTKHRR